MDMRMEAEVGGMDLEIGRGREPRDTGAWRNREGQGTDGPREPPEGAVLVTPGL